MRKKLLKFDFLQSFKFQGAAQIKVYHGKVNILGCIFSKDDMWHKVISDPRKNMLLDIKNESQDEAEENLQVALDDSSIFSVKSVPKKAAVIGVKEYKDYSNTEEQFLVPSDPILQIRNVSTQVDSKKGFFSLNESWKENIDALVQSISQNNIFLVNGVVNSGKSTFISCLINQILTRSDSQVYMLDLDPGQPNYNLAGQVALLKLNQKILTNSDFNSVEILKAYYLNTPTPNLNMAYYNACVDKLVKEYQQINNEEKKTLIVNTCGWVEGLGAQIQMKIVEQVKPQIIVTMTKQSQGLKGNEFSQKCRSKYGELKYLDVVNDSFEGAMNIKGAVQRNRKMIHALAFSDSDHYLFNQNVLDGQSQLPVKFQSKTLKQNEFSLSKSQAFKIQTKPFSVIPFSKAALCLIREQLDQISSKIDTLRFYNCEIVAGIKIDNAQFKSLRSFDDVRITEIPFKSQTLPPIQILFYGLIRDIDYNEGIKIIPQNNIDISDLDFNAICLAHDSIFRFPSSYLMQDDAQEMILKEQVEKSTKQIPGKPQAGLKHFMADLH